MPQNNIIYLDHNATTPVSANALSAMRQIQNLPLNASSIHSLGRKARGLIEESRANIAKLTNCGNCRIIFTSSGTESNNMALTGLAGYKIITSNIEHASILKTGTHAGHIPVTNTGIVDIAYLEKTLRQYAGEKILVSIMLANNETGVIQPITEIAQLVHKHGGIIHTDAAQCFGKISVDMQELGVDMLTISAHKLGGPQGAAALIARKNVPLCSIITGGGQEQGYRAGTENIPAIYGFGVACGEALQNAQNSHTESLRQNVETQIKNITQEALIFGDTVPRLPNTSLITMPNVSSETQIIHFDMEGIALSSGAACSSGKIETSHVLLAMGIDPEIAKCAIRISFGNGNNIKDAESFVMAWKKLYERAGSVSAA